MAGTDGTRASWEGGPAIVLVEPQLGENIGMASRAMLNCGLTDMRVVNPRQPFPNDYAMAAAVGSDRVLTSAGVFGSVRDAVTDLQHVFAATARPRDMVKPVVTPREAARLMREAAARGERCGILFGRERTGLHNDELMLAQTIVTAPLNPAYSSLNIAQAVLLLAWEHLMAADATPVRELPLGGNRLANGEELANFFDHLARDLDEVEFFRAEHMRPVMWQNLRNIFLRAELTEQEVRTLHGALARLSGRRQGRQN